MKARPCSPETAAFMASSLACWNDFLADSQSDTDSDRQSSTLAESSNFYTDDDDLDDIFRSLLPAPIVPPRFCKVYGELASLIGASYADFAELDVFRLETIVEEIYMLLRDAILTGRSCHWDEFDCWLDFGHKLVKVLMAKKEVAPEDEDYDTDTDSEELSECGDGSFTTLIDEEDLSDGEFIREFYTRGLDEEDLSDGEFIRELYTRGLDELILIDWDDVIYPRDIELSPQHDKDRGGS
ncbi:hypothetical protein B0F90DRAFT_1114367 [Multifurca ochricompacta]|uniref:Uncharacterized protein n=1 Tax=Multifurca ochricompacta TaxID=376703 RepID=A0AAD4M1I7_9AGAM|nr:hypothetical protein B0F90DRAFT_1114367 [Multifurca ochricompacta]